jgi:hypothetical protein
MPWVRVQAFKGRALLLGIDAVKGRVYVLGGSSPFERYVCAFPTSRSNEQILHGGDMA